MSFISIGFLCFFPLTVIIFYLLKNELAQTCWLLLASYFFYACFQVEFTLLLLLITGVTYLGAIQIEKNTIHKKKIMIGAIVCCLAVLFFFKYFNFAMLNVSSVLSVFSINMTKSQWDIILPVGISFYTFQAVGYLADVYQGKVQAEKNVFRYGLFLAFFPLQVSGPIERATNLLTQIGTRKRVVLEKVERGLLLMLWGFFLKMVLADRIAVYVDKVFSNYPVYNGLYIVIAVLLYAFQIYGDFAGYSYIAMGAAEVMGFDIIDNFNAPYLSKSVSEFWRRWHISLSSWFRDYLYIPLGGNRKGKIRTYLNVMIVFLLSGLWHGAMWSFVVWGGLNGLYQILGKQLKTIREKLNSMLGMKVNSFSHEVLQVISTFLLVDFAWLFFRASGFKEAILMIKAALITYNPWIIFDGSLYKLGLDEKNFHVMLFAILILVAADIIKKKKINIRDFVMKQELWFRWIFYIAGILIVLILGIWGSGYHESSFIYVRF